MQDKLSKHITGFRKSKGTQDCLMLILEKWKYDLDKGENICFIFGSLKGLLRNKSRFITSKVKNVWVFDQRIRSDVWLIKKPKTVSTKK